MKQETVNAIIDKKVFRIKKISGRIGEDFDAEAIHDIRTATKSLRAFMRMLAVAKGEKFKLPKEFKRLYHIVGDIREAQLELDKIRTAQLELPAYARHLNGIIEDGKKKWKVVDLEKAIAKLKDRVNGVDHGKITASSLQQFVKEQLEGIHNYCMGPHITDDIIHSMRKLLKDALYVIKGAQKEDEGIAENLNIDQQQLDHCSKLLGDYNDARIMMERMAAFASASGMSTEKQRIYELIAASAPKLHSERKRVIDEMLSLTHNHATTGSQTGTELQELSLGR